MTILEEEQGPSGIDLSGLLAWIRKDFVVILICLISLLGCMYTLYNIGSYQKACNDNWQQQLKGCICFDDQIAFNQSFRLFADYENTIQR